MSWSNVHNSGLRARLCIPRRLTERQFRKLMDERPAEDRRLALVAYDPEFAAWQVAMAAKARANALALLWESIQ